MNRWFYLIQFYPSLNILVQPWCDGSFLQVDWLSMDLFISPKPGYLVITNWKFLVATALPKYSLGKNETQMKPNGHILHYYAWTNYCFWRHWWLSICKRDVLPFHMNPLAGQILQFPRNSLAYICGHVIEVVQWNKINMSFLDRTTKNVFCPLPGSSVG